MSSSTGLTQKKIKYHFAFHTKVSEMSYLITKYSYIPAFIQSTASPTCKLLTHTATELFQAHL